MGNGSHGPAASQQLKGIQLQLQSRNLGHQVPLGGTQFHIFNGKGQVRTDFHRAHLQLSVDIFGSSLLHKRDCPVQSCGKDQFPQKQIYAKQDHSTDEQPFVFLARICILLKNQTLFTL